MAIKTNKQHGQAMLETLAALLFLAPLFAAVLLLPRWHAAAADSQEAARNLAFADIPVRNIVRMRAATSRQAFPDGAQRALNAVHTELRPVQLLTRSEFDLGESTFRDVSVRTAESNATARFEIPGRLALLRDDMASLRRSEVLQRSALLRPTAGLRAIEVLMRVERAAFVYIEPAFQLLCIGGMDPDIVPADRMPGGVAANRLPNFGRCN